VTEAVDLDLLRKAWEAIGVGDLSVVEAALDPEARWRAVADGPMNCEGRREIMEVLGRIITTGLRGEIEEMTQEGPRVLVGFRPELPRGDDRPLDGGIAYVVVTMRDRRIVELKGCADRRAALSYLQQPPETDPVRTEPRLPAAPPYRVERLVPFVHVEDVDRSVDFYRHLGFVVESVHEYRGRPVWAALRSQGAELMVTLDGDPIDPAGQGVLFYLYSPDLVALRDQLLAAGIEAGEIVDGSPGPAEEMRVVDPDGYVLMVAQIEQGSSTD
jgi:ketosteroid isomerase-like protein/catechol 2,3-dioxygenase-like lactoylglutathione lyase family enzyme